MIKQQEQLQNQTTVIKPKGNEDSQVILAKRSKKTEKIMKGVDIFFSNQENMGKLLPFLQQENKNNRPNLSMRLIEWFVNVYCKENIVDWQIGNDFFNVYLDYQEMMKDYRKQKFDFFARKWRKEKRKDTTVNPPREYEVQIYHGIKFYYTEKDYVVTTVAQLNFFQWFIEKGVLDYMIDHRQMLTEEMNQYNKDAKEKKKNKDLKKDVEIVADEKPKTSRTSRVSDEKYAVVAASPPTVTQSDIPVAPPRVRVHATKKVTKKNVEVYVSFD